MRRLDHDELDRARRFADGLMNDLLRERLESARLRLHIVYRVWVLQQIGAL